MFLLVFLSFFLCLSFSPHLPIAAVWTPPCLAAAWIRLHRTYLLDGLILSSYFSGLVVWWSRVLVPCPLFPWPGLQRIPGWAFLPKAGCTSLVLPSPHLCPPTKSACPAPQPTVLDSLRSGEGSHSPFPDQIARVSSGRECGQARGPELESKASENPSACSAIGVLLDFSSASFPLVSSGTRFSS